MLSEINAIAPRGYKLPLKIRAYKDGRIHFNREVLTHLGLEIGDTIAFSSAVDKGNKVLLLSVGGGAKLRKHNVKNSTGGLCYSRPYFRFLVDHFREGEMKGYSLLLSMERKPVKKGRKEYYKITEDNG